MRSLLGEVERLPHEYRQVLMMFYYDDLGYRGIADALGISAATVNARLTKARQLLRSRMTRTPQAKAFVANLDVAQPAEEGGHGL